ncbi:MAG: hypothetical protein HFI34_10010 [Lachnospiraceae bacterium]|nr:hypothetical protein [Lachnospiraceae bacterium]
MGRGKRRLCRCVNRCTCDRRWLNRKCVNLKKSFDEVFEILNPGCKCCRK